ncbi:MAG: hypothetical protein V1716_03320 [Candidatus Uhrbacteria bacterium]
MKNVLLKENIIKNVLVIIFSILFFIIFAKPILEINASQINDFLLTVSILLVTVCFANFAFTYEKSKVKTFNQRLFPHATTFVFMFLLALLLGSLVMAVGAVYPTLKEVIFIFSFLLYFGTVLYDFWDVLRVE